MSELTLPEYNPYAYGVVESFSDETMQLIRTPLNPDDVAKDLGQYHVVKQNDRLDLLAYKYYNGQVERAARWYWLIADANEIFNPLDLSDLVGQEILIPNVLNVRLNLP